MMGMINTAGIFSSAGVVSG